MIAFLLAVLALLALLVIGLPVAFCLALVGVVGFALVRGIDPAIIMVGQVGLDAAVNSNRALYRHDRLA